MRDLISTVTTTDPAYAWGIKAANLDRTDIRMHQFEVHGPVWRGWRMSGHLSLVDEARTATTGNQPAGVPTRIAGLSLKRPIGEIQTTISTRWWGSVWEDAQNSRHTEPGHEVDLRLEYGRAPWQISLGIENLTDESEERLLGYTRPGRRVTCTLATTF